MERAAAIIGGWVTAHQYARIRGEGELDSLADVLTMFEPQPEKRPQTTQEMIGAWRVLVVTSGGTLADQELAEATGMAGSPYEPQPPQAEKTE